LCCVLPCRFRKGIEAKAQLLADIKQVIRQSDASSSDGASAFELSLKSHRANQVLLIFTVIMMPACTASVALQASLQQ
jgi:hypothetical protein